MLAALLAGCGPTAPVGVAVTITPAATRQIAASAPTATSVAAGSPTTGPPAPTSAPTSAAAAQATLAPLTIVVPAAAPTEAARPVPIEVGQDFRSELATYFATFYKARTLARGCTSDFATPRALTDAPYREYTTTLRQKDAGDAKAGKLVTVKL